MDVQIAIEGCCDDSYQRAPFRQDAERVALQACKPIRNHRRKLRHRSRKGFCAAIGFKVHPEVAHQASDNLPITTIILADHNTAPHWKPPIFQGTAIIRNSRQILNIALWQGPYSRHSEPEQHLRPIDRIALEVPLQATPVEGLYKGVIRKRKVVEADGTIALSDQAIGSHLRLSKAFQIVR